MEQTIIKKELIKLRNLEPINLVTEEHFKDLKQKIILNGYDENYPIYYSSIHKKIVTGSHRYKIMCELNFSLKDMKKNMVDIGQEVEEWLYMNEYESFSDYIDFGTINDFEYYEMLKYFGSYDDENMSVKYGKCDDCERYLYVNCQNLCFDCGLHL